MKIKRFIAKNMREAIRLVREEQGPDSVILSNRRVPGGIEVVAATDYDEALMQQSLRRAANPPVAKLTAPPEPAERITPPMPDSERSTLDVLLKDFGSAPNDDHYGNGGNGGDRDLRPAANAAVMGVSGFAANQAATLIQAVSGSNAMAMSAAPSHEYLALQRDLGGLREMIEQQLGCLSWNDLRHHRPQRYAVLKTLTELGLDASLAREIADQLPEATNDDRARFLPLGLLARRIPVARHDLIQDGGIIALVGPTGVGKTTTIAKLAARYAERHGLRDIALVAMDHYRIGAQEQLYTYGRLLGVPVYTVTQQTSLRETLAKLSYAKLVLIDTVGMSPRDGALAEQVAMLNQASPRLKTWLTIAATSQSGDQDEVLRRFGGVADESKPQGEPSGRLHGCILSKLDETSRIGGALSVAIRHRLPLAYVTDGQRVPEDLQVARADQLVIRAQQLARATPMDLDDETMALRFAAMFESPGQGSNPNPNPLPTGVAAHV